MFNLTARYNNVVWSVFAMPYSNGLTLSYPNIN